MIALDPEEAGRLLPTGPAEQDGGAVQAGLVVNPVEVEGVVFCGGASRRMGADKAQLPAPGGGSLLERALDVLDEIAPRVVLASGSSPRYEAHGRDCVLDDVPEAGPLAGLAAALESTSATWLCVLACDMPAIGSGALRALLAEAVEKDLDACLLETAGGIEPLCAVYRATCREPVVRALEAGERRMDSFHGSGLRVGTLRAENLSGSDACAANVNTRDDYARVMGLQQPSNPEGELS